MLLWISFIVMFAWAFIEPQFMFYAYGDLGWTSSQLGLAMSAYGVTFMLGEFLLGRWSDRSGRRPVLLLGLGLFISQFVGLAISQNFAWIAFSFILAGLGNAIFDPALCAYRLDIAPLDRQARTIGIKSTIGSLGNVLGPALVVVFTPYLAPAAVLWPGYAPGQPDHPGGSLLLEPARFSPDRKLNKKHSINNWRN